MMSDTEPRVGDILRHNKRGTEYQVLHIATMQHTVPDSVLDEAPVVVYRCAATGKIYVRPVHEFTTDRFTNLGPG